MAVDLLLVFVSGWLLTYLVTISVAARSSVASGGEKNANTLQKAQFLALQVS